MNNEIKEFLKTLSMFIIGMVIIFWVLIPTFMKPLISIFV